MRAIFSVYGYGLGHATRVKSVINELRGDYLITASGDAFDYFKRKGLNPYRINSFRIGNFINSFSWIQTLFQNFDFPINMMADFSLFKRLINDFKPDLIVSDTEPVSMTIANSFGLSTAFLSNLVPIVYEYSKIDSNLKSPSLDNQARIIKLYLERTLQKSDLIISPTITRYNAGFRVKFTDLIVSNQRLNSDLVIKRRHDLPKDFILVSFGGASITSEYYKLLIPVLKRFKGENFVVSTNGAVKRVTRVGNLILYPFIDEFQSFMKASKGVITLAGHSTISESLVRGKPLLVIPIKEHVEQLVNAYLISEKRFGCSLLGELGSRSLELAVTEFVNNLDFYLKNIKRAGFKGLGARQVAGLIQNFKK